MLARLIVNFKFSLVNPAFKVLICFYDNVIFVTGMNKALLSAIGLVTLVGMVASPVYATTYYGPSFGTTPGAIPPGGTANIVLSTGSNTSFVAPPSGSTHGCTPGTVCVYPLQACTNPSAFYFSVHQITVKDPNNNDYMLGSATTSGMAWPVIFGGPVGQTTANGFADALNVTIGDSFSIPFGPGAGGFSFTSLLGNPPNNVSPAGPYYWWTVAGNVNGADLRLDQHPTINPTAVSGVYQFDVEGTVVCSGSDITVTSTLFFDAGHGITVPEFAGPMMATVAIAFVGMAILLRRNGIRA